MSIGRRLPLRRFLRDLSSLCGPSSWRGDHIRYAKAATHKPKGASTNSNPSELTQKLGQRVAWTVGEWPVDVFEEDRSFTLLGWPLHRRRTGFLTLALADLVVNVLLRQATD